MSKRFSITVMIGACTAALLLSGCANMKPGKASAASDDSSAKVASAIASAAKEAADDGMTRQSLAFQEKLYNNDPRNEDYIISYARGLRHAGRIDDAILVIRTPANGKRVSEPLLTECAMVLIAAAQYEDALGYAQQALDKNSKSPNAHHALALALSGMDKNADAQLQFQKALDLWPETRDRTPIINNLAMSLAAQGKISEARTVMSLATGEALRSRTYQNNRALLDTLKDRDIRAEKLPDVEPAAASADEDDVVETADAPAPKMAPRRVRPVTKMQPIIE